MYLMADAIEGVPVQLQNLVADTKPRVNGCGAIINNTFDEDTMKLCGFEVCAAGGGSVWRFRPLQGITPHFSKAAQPGAAPALAGDDKPPVCREAVSAQDNEAGLENGSVF